MLTKNPNDRIEIIDICLHKWVTNNDQDSVNLDLSEVSDLSIGHSLEEDSKFPGFEYDLSPDLKLEPSPIANAIDFANKITSFFNSMDASECHQ